MRYRITLKGFISIEQQRSLDYYIRLFKHWLEIEFSMLDVPYYEVTYYDDDPTEVRGLAEMFEPSGVQWEVEDMQARARMDMMPPPY